MSPGRRAAGEGGEAMINEKKVTSLLLLRVSGDMIPNSSYPEMVEFIHMADALHDVPRRGPLLRPD